MQQPQAASRKPPAAPVRVVDGRSHPACRLQAAVAYPYRALAPINVGGTRTVLELAAEHSTKPLHHISTIAVIAGFGTAGVTHVDEQTPLDDADRLSPGYPETKWVAENLVVEAGRRGLPVAIHRPYEVTGTVDRGVWNTDTMMCALFRTIAETGLAPDMALPLDFVPVDHTADAITHIITHQEPDGRVYHLTNSHAAPGGRRRDGFRCAARYGRGPRHRHPQRLKRIAMTSRSLRRRLARPR